MNRALCGLAIAASLLWVPRVSAQENNPLTRDEVSVIKKKLQAVFDALGQAPLGYSKENENFSLPTEAYKNSKSGLWQPIGASAERNFGTQKKAEQENQDLQKDYQKKILEAQAKGDYQEIARLSQEMQKTASEKQLKTVEASKEPIRVDIRFNGNPGATIDPDAVLFEHPGVIALKSDDQSTPGKERINIYYDPVSLKDTKQLSRVDMKMPEDGSKNRVAVLNVTVELYGPLKEIEPWAKKFDSLKILAQISGAH